MRSRPLLRVTSSLCVEDRGWYLRLHEHEVNMGVSRQLPVEQRIISQECRLSPSAPHPTRVLAEVMADSGEAVAEARDIDIETH